jgi:hypothetical protein
MKNLERKRCMDVWVSMEGNGVGECRLDLSGSGMGRVMTSYYYCNGPPCSVHLGEVRDCLSNWSVLSGVSYCMKTTLPVTAHKVMLRTIFLYYRYNKSTRSSRT